MTSWLIDLRGLEGGWELIQRYLASQAPSLDQEGRFQLLRSHFGYSEA
jgi:hypothetical protein